MLSLTESLIIYKSFIEDKKCNVYIIQATVVSILMIKQFYNVRYDLIRKIKRKKRINAIYPPDDIHCHVKNGREDTTVLKFPK